MKIIQEEPKQLKTDYEVVAPVKQEYKKVGSINLKRGMTLYEFDFKTCELKPVEIDRKEMMIDINGNPVKNAKAKYNPNALYIQALNMKNAKKKVMKFLIKHNLIVKQETESTELK